MITRHVAVREAVGVRGWGDSFTWEAGPPSLCAVHERADLFGLAIWSHVMRNRRSQEESTQRGSDHEYKRGPT
ncbi:hypothetical protein BHM03_00025954 [Ensete ventricosum]|nr:hypothetical protein BHM03_00025954 [Ensete ventricosum]